jgi:hypothetical protein
VTGRLRDRWAPGNVALVRRTVAADCNDSELSMFLELCSRYRLDPFAKQIWAAKIGGKVAIIVSRDGLLAIADRHRDFEGMDGDVVRANDEFKIVFKDGERAVEHTYETTAMTLGGDEPLPEGEGERRTPEPLDAGRGPILGAWAMVHRRGRKPTYFFAPFNEYKGRNVWDSNPSAMILKVAESMALRKAFTISGVVGEDEVADRVVNTTSAPAGPTYGDAPGVAHRMEQLMDALEWTERKRLVKLAPLNHDDQRLELIEVLEAECKERGLEVPDEDAEEVDGQVVAA